MAFFRYSAADAKGVPLNGTIESPSPEAALNELTHRGYRQVRLIPFTPTTAPRPEAKAAPTPAVVSPTPTTTRPTVRTKKLGDKQRFFLFSQIAQQLKAGISPANGFSTIAGVTSDRTVKESLQYIADAANNGVPISDAMAVYPDLYPQHVVGLARAGEEGGFLPDALRMVSEQAGAAHKFKRFHWFVWVIAINAILAIPLVWLATRALLLMYDKLDKSGGGGGWEALSSAFSEKFAQFLPYVLAIYAVLAVLYFYFSSDKFKMARHRLGLKWPVLGKRARHESVSIFSWCMARVAHAGLAPYRVWALAADAVPNLEMRRRLLEAGSKMTHEAKLSDVIFGSRLFPEEFAPVISTGELTGDIAGALEQLADASKTEYEAANTFAKMRTAGWGVSAGCLTAGIALIIFAYFWYNEMFNKALSGIEQTP